MKREEKTELIRLRISPSEHERIRTKMDEMKVHNQSAYLRKMALDGICVSLDLEAIRNLTNQISRIGNNLNQVAKRANENGVIYQEDLKRLQTQFEEILKHENEILKSLSEIR